MKECPHGELAKRRILKNGNLGACIQCHREKAKKTNASTGKRIGRVPVICTHGPDTPRTKRKRRIGQCIQCYRTWKEAHPHIPTPHEQDKKFTRKRRPTEERFWEKVDTNGNCWIWKGWQLKSGYGRFWEASSNKTVYAHRTSWVLANGQIPESLHVLHRCDNPSCVNPDHLFLGTHQDNMKDRDLKNRGRVTVVTLEAASEIERAYKQGASVKDIAKSFGVSTTTVYKRTRVFRS